ncbi:MAG: TRAFAC clade GTPase domain-containing protein [Mycobacterium sp.]|uniref:TRAFAC clade GTPase domain-containing protein n=1 Tax=Mycobacterium sp. TaxID=1785 RepID=UPI003F965709
MTKCPRCFSPLHDDLYAWTVSPQASGKSYRDPVASAFIGSDAVSGPIYNVKRPPGCRGPLPSDEDAAAALKAPAVEICPVCHVLLPDNWRQGHAVCVAMAGAPGTGKSTYLAVLINQLQLVCESLGASMESATRATADAYARHYEAPLFAQRGLIPPTPTMQDLAPIRRESLIFSVGSWNGRRRFLVIRDAAGEDLESADLDAPPFRYFRNADAVLFMFDPLRIKAIRDQLSDLLPDQSYGGGDPRTVLSNVLRAIGPGRPKLAVILSKFDALQALSDVEGSEWSDIMSNAGAAYLRDNSASRSYDERDGQLLHEEARSLLVRLHGASIVTAVENPASGVRLAHRYFTVSALGQAPAGRRLSSRGIAPFRCVDPLRWVTSAFGVL